jgi:cytochrome c oxidase subunit 2
MEESKATTESTSSMSPVVIGLIIFMVLIGGGVYYVFHKMSQSTQPTAAMAEKTITPTKTVSPTVKEFTVIGKNYSFSPNTITVKKGDNVTITFTDDEGFHNLIIEGYNEKTQTIRAGNSSVITFTADKTGSFAFYCGVGDHREKGMVGTFIVQ